MPPGVQPIPHGMRVPAQVLICAYARLCLVLKWCMVHQNVAEATRRARASGKSVAVDISSPVIFLLLSPAPPSSPYPPSPIPCRSVTCILFSISHTKQKSPQQQSSEAADARAEFTPASHTRHSPLLTSPPSLPSPDFLFPDGHDSAQEGVTPSAHERNDRLSD
eukprot:1219920-Rhodomonas_salina.1